MRRRLERAATFDRQGIAADAVDGGPECDEKARQVLHVRLGGGVAQHRGSARAHRRHQRVLGAGDARLVEKDVGALELALELVDVTDADLRAEALERQEVRVDAAATDHVAARRRERDASEPRQHRPGQQDRGADLFAQRRVERLRLGAARIDFHSIGPVPLHARPDVLQQRQERLNVANARDIVDTTRTVGEECRRENRKGRVLVAGGANRA